MHIPLHRYMLSLYIYKYVYIYDIYVYICVYIKYVCIYIYYGTPYVPSKLSCLSVLPRLLSCQGSRIYDFGNHMSQVVIDHVTLESGYWLFTLW